MVQTRYRLTTSAARRYFCVGAGTKSFAYPSISPAIAGVIRVATRRSIAVQAKAITGIVATIITGRDSRATMSSALTHIGNDRAVAASDPSSRTAAGQAYTVQIGVGGILCFDLCQRISDDASLEVVCPVIKKCEKQIADQRYQNQQ